MALTSVTVVVSGCSTRDKSEDKHDDATETAIEICDAEEGFGFLASGEAWPNTRISVSYLPDGTLTATSGSSRSYLHRDLDALFPRDLWQRQYARAMQIWSKYAPLEFRFVSDSGAAQGTSGLPQGDTRFGDIREGNRVQNYVGQSNFPSTTGTMGGDTWLNQSLNTYKINAHPLAGPDLFSLVLHETGHSLGLGHAAFRTVMYNSLWGVYTDLTADDIAGIQSRYGTRQPDEFDAAGANDSVDTAAAVSLTGGQTFIVGNLTTSTDVDHYRITIPSTPNSVLSISALEGESLLVPTVRLYDAVGNIVEEVSAAGYGQGALLQLPGVFAGETYTIGVQSGTDAEFAHGAYRLAVEFRVTEDGLAYSLPQNLAADNKEFNDSIALAKDLGSVSSNLNVSNLSVHWAWDQDFYKFKTATSAKTYEVSLTLAAGTQPLEIRILNSAGAEIARSATGQVSFPVTKSTVYRVHVSSPSGTPRGYSMMVRKLN